MITPYVYKTVQADQEYNATIFFGLSTDSKPVHAPNGTQLLEMDTGKVFFFDEQNEQWREI